MNCPTNKLTGNWKPTELEETRCDFCGADETIQIITRFDGLNVVECLRCRLAYLNPRPLT